jgi:hypothetical protein
MEMSVMHNRSKASSKVNTIRLHSSYIEGYMYTPTARYKLLYTPTARLRKHFREKSPTIFEKNINLEPSFTAPGPHQTLIIRCLRPQHVPEV